MSQVLRRLLCCSVIFAIGASWVLGQSHSSPSPNHLALNDALVRFQDAWGIDLSYDAALLDNTYTPWHRPVGRSVSEDLRALLQETGFEFYRLSSGSYSVRPEDMLYGAVSGTVYDADADRPLPRAEIILYDADGTLVDGNVTNSDGRFLLHKLRPGEYTLLIRHVGYKLWTETFAVSLGPSAPLAIQLEPQPIELELIWVFSNLDVDKQKLRFSNVMKQDDIVNQVSGLGVVDIVRNMNDVLGVRIDEISAGIHIQGGDRGEQQFLLDGSPVYEPVHLFGLVGSFNAFAINRITIDKTGFAASKGSYLSGVINAEHALMTDAPYPIDVQLDAMGFNAQVALALGQESNPRIEILAAFRKSLWDSGWSRLWNQSTGKLLQSWNDPDIFLLRASQFPIKSIRPDYYEALIRALNDVPPADLPEIDFNDVHLAGRVRFDNGHTLHGSFYRGDNRLHGRRLIATVLNDRESISNPDHYDWVNGSTQLNWSYLTPGNILLSTKVRGSHYHLQHAYAGLGRQEARVIPSSPSLFIGEGRLFINTTPTDDNNQIQEGALEATMDIEMNSGSLKTGVELIHSRHHFEISEIFPQSIEHKENTSHVAFFVEQQLKSASGMTFTAGSRFTYLGSRRKVYVEPRMDVTYETSLGAGSALFLRGAAGVYSQFLNQFDVSSISPSILLPSTRFWLPIDATLSPPRSYHFAADVGMQLLTNWFFRAEGYYKRQPRLFRIDYPSLWRLDTESTVGEEATKITTQAGFVTVTKGFSYGTAFALERTSSSLDTSVRYEYTIAEREYGFRDGIRMVPVQWSEPHRLELSLTAKPLPSLRFTARWRGGWGRVWGFRQAYYDFLGSDVSQVLTFGEHDFQDPTEGVHRLNSFQQLDVGLSVERPVGPGVLHVRLDMLNVTDRQNEADRSLVEQPQDDSVRDLSTQTRYFLSRTVSLSVRLQCCSW